MTLKRLSDPALLLNPHLFKKYPLSKWAKEHEDVLKLNVDYKTRVEEVVRAYQQTGPLLEDKYLEKINGDCILIASALSHPDKVCVVSNERSQPSAQRYNRKVPDVCKELDIRCINAVDFIKELDFKTDWNK